MATQRIIVYILIGIAVIGLFRYLSKKLRAFFSSKNKSACDGCPLKNACNKKDCRHHTGCCH